MHNIGIALPFIRSEKKKQAFRPLFKMFILSLLCVPSDAHDLLPSDIQTVKVPSVYVR
jgi:hypothetical protein